MRAAAIAPNFCGADGVKNTIADFSAASLIGYNKHDFISHILTSFCWGRVFPAPSLLVLYPLAAAVIVPAVGVVVAVVGGSITAVAVGVVAGGVVGAGGRVEAVNILGAVRAIAIACGTVTIHHFSIPHFCFVGVVAGGF